MTDEEALLAANAAYYQAFASSDFEAMAALWATDAISCIHPGWAILIGRDDVLHSYRLILSNPDQEPVSAMREHVIISGDMARVLCDEMVAGGRLAATNLFSRTPAGWRMVHHHASPIVGRMPTAQPTRHLN